MIPVPDGAAPEPRPSRLASAAFWLIPPLLCLALYWRGFTAWFRADDFAWLGTGLYIQNFHDFLIAIFAPMAQGTIRPLSERAFFMAGFSLFGLDALPFKIVIFATQFANLALVASIGERLSGLRWAGFFAAVFWVLNGAGIEPLGWSCVYNQVLCGFFLLLAFHFLLRYEETGERRYYWFQWARIPAGLRRAGVERGLPGDRGGIPASARKAQTIGPGGGAADVRNLHRVRAGALRRGAGAGCERLRDALHGRHVPHAGQVLDLVGRPHLSLHAVRAAEVGAARGNRGGLRGPARVPRMEAARRRADRPVWSGVVSGTAGAGAAAARSPDRVLRLPSRDRALLARRLGGGCGLAGRHPRTRRCSRRSPLSIR